MNNSRILKIGCAVAMAIAPYGVKAASLDDGLSACADALVSELASGNGSTINYSMSPNSDSSSSRLKDRETIHLDVRDPRSQEVVARADCVVDSRARVKRLVSVPLEAADAEKRARTL